MKKNWPNFPFLLGCPYKKSREKCIGSCCFPNFFCRGPLIQDKFSLASPDRICPWATQKVLGFLPTCFLLGCPHSIFCETYVKPGDCAMRAWAETVWPSGLRRWLKAPFRKGVGSNPTAVILLRRVFSECCLENLVENIDAFNARTLQSFLPVSSVMFFAIGNLLTWAPVISRWFSPITFL